MHTMALAVLLALFALSWGATAVRDNAFIGYSEKKTLQGASAANSHPYVFVITTKFGKIRISPRADLSPNIVRVVEEVAKVGNCSTCNFYRHEPVPQGWGVNGFWGPPYALLQGSLQDIKEQPPFEGHPVVKLVRGDVCMIPNCKEFFIALADHDEWGQSHTVWGKVADAESWAAIAAHPTEPCTKRTDQYNITTSWLTPEANIKFQITMEYLH